jgi:hypothetical protein
MPVPAIGGATCVRKHDLGAYEAFLLSDIENVGLIAYLYVMPVYSKAEKHPVLFITSEANMMASMGGGSHFLCAFHRGQHLNFGASNAWADIDRFEAAALIKIRERLGTDA